MKIKLSIAEDIPELAKSLQQKYSEFEDIELVFIASNGVDLLEQLKENNDLDIILMDINMPVMNGIEAAVKVKKLYPEIKIIMHTVFDEDDKIFESILAGATGYILKDDQPSEVISALSEAMEGGAPMSTVIASKVLKLIKITSESNRDNFDLTKRELQILQRLGKGENYQQIANVLFISPKTVRNHIENIYKKLQVHNKVDAVTIAIKNKLISP